MKEYTERLIQLSNLDYPEKSANEIERIAKEMKDQGWYFLVSQADELLETITLFFERDTKV